MHCPKDKIPCDTKQLEDVSIDVCPKCDGVWLEKEEVRKLTRHFSVPKYSTVDELMDEWDVIVNQGTAPDDFWSEDKLVCSKDNSQMFKHYFAGSNVGVDQCQVCQGFWLDGGELHAIAKYIGPDPDLDKAWQSFIRDDNEWREKMEKAKLLPANLALLAAGPKYAIYMIGKFVMQIVIDMIKSRDRRS